LFLRKLWTCFVAKLDTLRHRYTEGYFSPNYKLTIGVDFALKTVESDDGSKVALQLWDIAGCAQTFHICH
jgi:Ras-related protein Rab-32